MTEILDINGIKAACTTYFDKYKTKLVIDRDEIEGLYTDSLGIGEGEFCMNCPVLREMGSCSIRNMFAHLLADHQEDEDNQNTQNAKKPKRTQPGIDEWWDGGWPQIY